MAYSIGQLARAASTDLQRMRDTLDELSRRCSGYGAVAGCPIIEALADEDHENAC